MGSDADKDVAVLLLNAPEDQLKALKTVKMGADDLVVGQKVYAIGYAGSDHTLSQGIISGLGQKNAILTGARWFASE